MRSNGKTQESAGRPFSGQVSALNERQLDYLKKRKSRERALHGGTAISFLFILLLFNIFIAYIGILSDGFSGVLSPLLICCVAFMEIFIGFIIFLFLRRVFKFPVSSEGRTLRLKGVPYSYSIRAGYPARIKMPIYMIDDFILEVEPTWQQILSFRSEYELTVYPEYRYYSLLERVLLKSRNRAIVLAVSTMDKSIDLRV